MQLLTEELAKGAQQGLLSGRYAPWDVPLLLLGWGVPGPASLTVPALLADGIPAKDGTVQGS